MRRSQLLSLFVVLALLAGCASRGDPEARVAVGSLLPQAEFTTGRGERVSVADLQGKPAVINFWATWCGPCREEIPVLQAAHADHEAEGIVFLAVTDELPTTVRPFMDRLKMTLPVWYDPNGRAGKLYRIQSIPTTLFLNSDGVLVARHTGALTRPLLEQYLAQISADEQPAPTAPPAPTTPAAPPAPTPRTPPSTGGDGVGWQPSRPIF